MRTSSKAAVVVAVALATLVVGSTAATAANPHFKGRNPIRFPTTS